MQPYVFWFVVAAGLMVAEMFTGTFYMLVLSLAMCVGSLSALLGMNEVQQLTLTALAGIFGIIGLSNWKKKRAAVPDRVRTDIGQMVQVSLWREDGSLRVRYRGAEWNAELETPDTSHEVALYIKAMRGSTLILTAQKPN